VTPITMPLLPTGALQCPAMTFRHGNESLVAQGQMRRMQFPAMSFNIENVRLQLSLRRQRYGRNIRNYTVTGATIYVTLRGP
jgi:hypothetical protein